MSGAAWNTSSSNAKVAMSNSDDSGPMISVKRNKSAMRQACGREILLIHRVERYAGLAQIIE